MREDASFSDESSCNCHVWKTRNYGLFCSFAIMRFLFVVCAYIYKKRLKLSRKSSLSPVGFDGTIDMGFSFVRKMGVFPSHFIIVLGFASFLSVKFGCV